MATKKKSKKKVNASNVKRLQKKGIKPKNKKSKEIIEDLDEVTDHDIELEDTEELLKVPLVRLNGDDEDSEEEPPIQQEFL